MKLVTLLLFQHHRLPLLCYTCYRTEGGGGVQMHDSWGLQPRSEDAVQLSPGTGTTDQSACSVRLLLCLELQEVLWKEAREIYDVRSTLKECITCTWRPDKHKDHLQSTSAVSCLALTRMALLSPSLVFTATCREALWDSRGHGSVVQHAEIPSAPAA